MNSLLFSFKISLILFSLNEPIFGQLEQELVLKILGVVKSCTLIVPPTNDYEYLSHHLIDSKDAIFAQLRLSPKAQIGPLSAYKSHQKYTKRFLSLISASDFSESVILFSNLLTTQSFDSLVKRDSDYFIFLARKSDNLESILLSKFASELKFKILIRGQAVHTVCFFCNNGNPDILEVPGVGAGMGGLGKLYPDFTHKGFGHRFKTVAPTGLVHSIEIGEQVQGSKWYLKRGTIASCVKVTFQKLNFTFDVEPSSGGGSSGSLLKNGSWVGAVKDVESGFADFSLTSATTFSRFPLVSFSKPMFYSWVNFAVGPPTEKHSWDIVHSPLSNSIWLCILVALILSVLTLKIVRTSSPGANKNVPHQFDNQSFSFLVMILLEKCFPFPKENITRVILSTWLLAALVLNCAYRTKLLSKMVFPNYSAQPRTMVELSDSPDYQWGMEIGVVKSAAYLQLSQSNNSVYQKIFKGIQILPSSYSCFKRSLKENFACIDWEPGAHYMIPRNFSDKYGRHGFVLSKDLTFFNQVSLAMRRGNLIRQHLDKVIESLREMGLVSQWREMDEEQIRRERIQWEVESGVDAGGQDKIDKDKEDTKTRNILKFHHLLGSFYVVIFGLIIALIYFSIELVFPDLNKSLGVYILNRCKEFPAGKLIMLL